MGSRILFILLCLAVLAICSTALSESGDPVLLMNEEQPLGERTLLRFYQENISIHNGARCRFYPTCSIFYREALDQFGAFWATLMLLDRLLYREHGWPLKEYPMTEDGERYYDPVHRNYILNSEDYYR